MCGQKCSEANTIKIVVVEFVGKNVWLTFCMFTLLDKKLIGVVAGGML